MSVTLRIELRSINGARARRAPSGKSTRPSRASRRYRHSPWPRRASERPTPSCRQDRAATQPAGRCPARPTADATAGCPGSPKKETFTGPPRSTMQLSVFGLALRDRCAFEKRNREGQIVRIERAVAEKIKVRGLPVAQMDRNCGSAIQNELRRDLSELIPKPPLRRRENVEARGKEIGHRDLGQSRRHSTTSQPNRSGETAVGA